MKKLHEKLWKDYGSELSAGLLARKEEELEKEIQQLKSQEENLAVV